MFKDEFQAVCNGGAAKMNLLKKNPVGYFVSAMVAGMFISLGGFAAFTLGYYVKMGGAVSFEKAAAAATFSAALSLVVMAGAELFTGNNFVMAAASMRKSVSWIDTIALWVVCWVGNFVGSLISVGIFKAAGCADGERGAYFAAIASGKVALEPIPLIAKAILCNILVCLGVWCAMKMKSESGKLIMIFWCVFMFMVCGFEHSIANMSIEGVALFNGDINAGSYFYSILLATLGNVIGGAFFLALPYHIISKEKNN